jgi:hypothetical protein
VSELAPPELDDDPGLARDRNRSQSVGNYTRRVGAKCKGTLRGTSMSGTWISPEGGGSWSAHKVS